MNLLAQLQSVFSLAGADPIVSEKYSTLSLGYKTTWPDSLTVSAIQDCLRAIPEADEWSLTAVISDETVPISSKSDLQKGSQILRESVPHLQGRGVFELSLDIQKSRENGKINIYSFEAFNRFVREAGTFGFLKSVGPDKLAHKRLTFLFLDENVRFSSSGFIFLPVGESEPEDIPYGEFDPDKSCDFNLRHEFPFAPSTFRLLQRSSSDTDSEKVLDRLFSLFVVSSIFDSVQVQSGLIKIRLAGFRIIDWEFPTDEFCIGSRETYWKICEWVYAEPTKITDKLGLTRNILSTYLKQGSLELSESAFQSIVSGYRVYLKENLTKYLDLRGKIHDELSEISKKASDLINGYLSDYQKSTLTVLSFFITVFVVRFFATANQSDVFNREATILTLVFLGVSLFYFMISLGILNKEKKRLETRYRRLKERFKDLLHEDDIRAILNNDGEFNDEIDFVKSRRFWFSFLWVATIAALLVVVLSLSTSLNWNYIYEQLARFARPAN